LADFGNLAVRKALIIASEVRSGSTFVAESIAYHFDGVFGDVLFGLTKENFADLRATSSGTEILTKFNSLYLGHQGWVATKIMCAALSIIVREARIADSLKEAMFGSNAHWLIVRRRKKISQAVSLAYARKTGDWHVYGPKQNGADKPNVTFKETEDALRSILLSDIYLETFSSLIARDKKIEVFYEDFLAEPSSLIEHVYDVLGLTRPKDGVSYVDKTKIRREATGQKRQSESNFNAWLLENYYPVDKPQAPKATGLSAQVSAAQKQTNDFRVAIVHEFTRKRRSIRSLAEKYGVEASLISYWIAKHKHGELDERSTGAEELSFYKGKVALLERQLDELRRLAGSDNSACTITSGRSATERK
jgi:LPS sulfotransferase NodH/transposase-like protein